MRAPALLLLLGVAIGLWSHFLGALPGEGAVLDRFYYRAGGGGPKLETLRFIEGFGAAPVVLTSLPVLMWFIAREWGVAHARVLPFVLIAPVVAYVFKVSTGPTDVFLEVGAGIVETEGGNMPSGHTAYVVALGALIALTARRRGRTDVAALALAPGVAIGPSMVLLGGHTVADVLAGGCLGLATALAIDATNERRAAPHEGAPRTADR